MNRFLGRCVLSLIFLGILPVLLSAQTAPPSKPIRVKVVVVAMFERGEDTGDTPANINFGSSVNTWIKSLHSLPGITTCA